MSRCIHLPVCRFNTKRVDEEICFFQDICKYWSLLVIGAKNKKREKSAKAGDRKLNREYTTSSAHITMVRNYLRQWQARGKLSENQVAAVDAIGPAKTRDLNDGQREQLLSIFNDVKKGKE